MRGTATMKVARQEQPFVRTNAELHVQPGDATVQPDDLTVQPDDAGVQLH